MSGQIRTEKDVKKLISNGVENTPKVISDTPHMWNMLPNGKEVSLKSETYNTIRTPLEDSLLVVFDDLLINSKFPKCYFIVSNNNIGVCKLDGTIVVPPVPGVPRKIAYIGGLRVGDTSDFSEIENYFRARTGERARGAGGNLMALLDDKTLKPIIPLGKYDFIYFTAKGMNSYYYVAKKIDDKFLWGCLNSKGEEIVQCSYRSIKLENGTFQGDDSEDMFTKISYLKQKINEYANKLDNSTAILLANSGKFLTKFGNGIIQLDESLRESGFYDAISEDSNGDIPPATTNIYNDIPYANTSHDYQSEYDRWARRAESDYNSITNLGYSKTDKQGKKSGSAGKSMSGGNYTSMKRSFIEAQNQMKSIRRKAKAAGVTIQQSKWETATISY